MSAGQIADIAAPATSGGSLVSAVTSTNVPFSFCLKICTPPGAREHEVGPKVVVQIRGGHPRSAPAQTSDAPAGKGNVTSAPTRTSRAPAAKSALQHITSQPHGAGPRVEVPEAETAAVRIDGKGELFVSRSWLRFRIAKARSTASGARRFTARRAHRRERRTIVGSRIRTFFRKMTGVVALRRLPCAAYAFTLSPNDLVRLGGPGRGILRQRIEPFGKGDRVCFFLPQHARIRAWR